MIFDREKHLNEPISIEKELKVLFETNQPLSIFEIGACEAEDSIKYSRLFPESKIYAFEPLPQNIKKIQENIRRYNIKNITVFDLALSSSIGTAEFHVSDGRPDSAPESDWDYGNKSSSLLQPDKHKDLVSFIHFKQKIVVNTITIETFCKNNNISVIDYIHMDVQGAELMVLQGAGDFINSIKVIWLEVSKVSFYKDQPLLNDINEFMAKNNFVLAKDCAAGIQGDQLYISRVYYPDYKHIIKKINKKSYFLLKKIIKKLNFK